MIDLANQATALRDWLFDRALPIWWETGADRIHGGFHEAIDFDGRPVPKSHRARTIARQVFSYCEAGRLGWNGPWRDAALHALEFFDAHFIAPDDTVVSVVGLNGQCSDARFELYNQAFALLAYASAHRTLGPAAGWRSRAMALRLALEQRFAHPQGGFLEGREARLPQCANPHMHLFEAAIAWSALDDDPGWARMADRLSKLCLDKMIEPATGALREFFDKDWTPAVGIAGKLCEPGHHYEWAVLFDRWARRAGRKQPDEVSRIVAFADAYGVSAEGFVMNAVLTDGSVHDPVARLWAQAERIRAYLAQGRSREQLSAAIESLWRFLATPTAGLWFDQLDENNVFVIEPARATSLYHVIGVVGDLACLVPDELHDRGQVRRTLMER
jgi:mannose-6-phosphate isomerase